MGGPWWWAGLAGIWGIATVADRLWLHADQRLPSWDQADYLNSAVDHGRALGLLAGGGWQGWHALLDLSPKIPPLASLINGAVMAVTGQAPDQASWALAGWHGLLLLAVACWGRQLLGKGFGLLAALLVACTPALAALRIDYTLDIPLTASTTLALWLLGRWQAPAPQGGRWPQATWAALAVVAAVMVKQSALLVVALPSFWCAFRSFGEGRRRAQVVLGLAIVAAVSVPWLHHNWITTLGGTNRAVVESAANEGDPASLSLASWLWYLRLMPEQLGAPLLLPAFAGLGVLLLHWRRRRPPFGALPPGWAWLIGCTLAGWVATSLSPNKDARYIAPVLPLVVLLVTRLWWELGAGLNRALGNRAAAPLLGAGILAASGLLASERKASLQAAPGSPAREVVARLRSWVGEKPTTLVVVPNDAELNEHTLTSFGRLEGGQLLARRLGKRREDQPVVLDQAEWVLLASGEGNGPQRPSARELARQVRSGGRFERRARWPWDQGREVELWQRRSDAPAAQGFDERFIQLARAMEAGPSGLAAVFAAIGAQHQLDGHFLYQQRVRNWATERLQRDPNDRDALWSLGLIATLRNRPAEADGWFLRLQKLEPSNPWPVAYRGVVSLADWRPWKADSLIRQSPDSIRDQPVVRGLADLSAVLGGNLGAIADLKRHLPDAVDQVRTELKPDRLKPDRSAARSREPGRP
jgi:4-amino-4-deoxy-L-arabinose transferase-like glycosyltransferase